MSTFNPFGFDFIRRARAIGVTFSRATDGTVAVHGPASPQLRELVRDSRYVAREILDALDSGVEIVDLATERARRRPQPVNRGGVA